ncbi:hypothetical protein [Thermospira aquatica]|uniref:DUF4296 domain-containing protein n=1 Tax=Thermospira aquatica TaxID=2828656 RepID=A0AAX3BG89_9SPIR|nr:hypothetical protein [Thermospira aquatica]URA11295.1 hypothetical protein KDW03_05725 [Thermospira aquatica]
MKKYVFFVTLLAVVFVGCSPKKSSAKESEEVSSKQETVQEIPDFIKIRPGDKVILNSPQVFWEITILLNYEQKKWLAEQTNTNEDVSDEEAYLYLQNKREEFFQSLGLSEDLYNQYSFDHYQKIQDFLEKNPQYKEAYENSQNL